MTNFTLRMPDNIREALAKAASAHNTDSTAIIRRAVEKYLEGLGYLKANNPLP